MGQKRSLPAIPTDHLFTVPSIKVPLPPELPDSTLPLEVLVNIFRLLPPDPPTFSYQSTPWTLSRVCRAWRKVAHATPSLWTTINIDTSHLTSPLHGYTHMLHKILKNSQDHHLDVKITINPMSPPNGIQIAQISFNTLHDERHRWRSLSLHLPSPQIMKTFRPLYEIPTSSNRRLPPLRDYEVLESVDLSFVDSDRDRLLLLPLQRSTPVLKKAVLRTFESLSYPSSLPYRQMTHLDIAISGRGGWPAAAGEHQLLSALVQCTRLQTLVIRTGDRICPDKPFDFHPVPLRIESLQTFEMYLLPKSTTTNSTDSNTRPDEQQSLTSRLELPNLQTLVLHGIQWNTNDDLTSLIHMLNRSSSPNLHTLTITEISMSDVTIERLLRSPAVERTVEKVSLKGHLVGYLFDRIAIDQKLLPELKELHLYLGCFGDVSLTPPIRKILNSVRLRTKELKKVDLEVYWHSRDDETVRQLRELENVCVRRLECGGGGGLVTSREDDKSGLRQEVLAVRQLGGILKEMVVGYQQRPGITVLIENMPAVNCLFTDLEILLQLTVFTDAELMWVGEAQYTLLAIGSGIMRVPRNEEFGIVERAKRLAKRLNRGPPAVQTDSGQVAEFGFRQEEEETPQKGPLSSLRKRWQAVRQTFGRR
ncbi:hypothetical protein L218DRAFT_742440 [Marasmius fiardii PR-910]|nr:hypothetical protein L218DRAFT_742440 [Marasmius fiardii PR-910]